MLKANILEPKTYLESFQLSIADLSWENSKRLKHVLYFRKYAQL